MSVYNATSRPYIENCKWIVPRSDQEEGYCKHVQQMKGARRSFYVENPEWIAPSTNFKKHYKEPYMIKRNPGPREYYRKRIRDEIEKEDSVPPVHRLTAYQVKTETPYFINDPSEMRDQNRLIKVNRSAVDPVHALMHNNARQVLYREVSLPPLEQRYLPVMSRLNMTSGPMNKEEIERLRFTHNNYMTYCDWGHKRE